MNPQERVGEGTDEWDTPCPDCEGSGASHCSVFSERGTEYRFNDVVEGLTTGRAGRLVQVRKGCGQCGSNIYFLRQANGKLCTVENDMLQHSEAMIAPRDDTPETEYRIEGEWPETGFIVENPIQPETPGSFSVMIHSPNGAAQPPEETP